MAKVKIGFDIGNSSMKIAVAKKSGMVIHEVRLPENMMENSGVAMPNAFSDFLKKTRRKLHLPKGEGALVIPANQVICRLVTLPVMTKEQLLMNLPYEFSDFMQGESDQYFCDYAVCDSALEKEEQETEEEAEQEAEEQKEMTMMAAAVSKNQAYQYIRMFAQAGIKLKILLPEEMALIQLVRSFREKNADSPAEYCFVDLGHQSTRITVVNRDRIQATRQVPLGGRNVDMVIADSMNVDAFLANSYKASNYMDVLQSPGCMEVYNQIAVEILKVINFYQFTFRESNLPGIYLIGGGAGIAPLCRVIEDVVGFPLLPLEEILPLADKGEPFHPSGIFAAGMALADKGGAKG